MATLFLPCQVTAIIFSDVSAQSSTFFAGFETLWVTDFSSCPTSCAARFDATFMLKIFRRWIAGRNRFQEPAHRRLWLCVFLYRIRHPCCQSGVCSRSPTSVMMVGAPANNRDLNMQLCEQMVVQADCDCDVPTREEG